MTKPTTLLPGVSLTLLLSAGCAVGPNYKRPSVDVPGMYRGRTPQDAAQPAPESLGDLERWEVFHDKQLQDLIHTGLNRTTMFASRQREILEAQAHVGITHTDQLPPLSARGEGCEQRFADSKLFHQYDANANQVDLSLAWDFDFWGRCRRFELGLAQARANELVAVVQSYQNLRGGWPE